MHGAICQLVLVVACLAPTTSRAFYSVYDYGCPSINVAEGSVLSGTGVQFSWPEVPGALRYWFRIYDVEKREWHGPRTTYTTSAYVTGLPDTGTKLRIYCYYYTGGWQRSIWEVYAYDKTQEPPVVPSVLDESTRLALADTNETINFIAKMLGALGALVLLFHGFNTGMHR